MNSHEALRYYSPHGADPARLFRPVLTRSELIQHYLPAARVEIAAKVKAGEYPLWANDPDKLEGLAFCIAEADAIRAQCRPSRLGELSEHPTASCIARHVATGRVRRELAA